MDKSFQFLFSEYGQFTDSALIAADSAQFLRGVFPAEFVDFLQKAGIGVWQKGRFQFCDPLGMTDIVKLLFDGDADFHPDRTFIYGYGATGRLFIWNADWFETFEIDLPRLEAAGLLNRNKKAEAKDTIVSAILYLDSGLYDLIDPATGKLILAKFVAKHGALKLGEVFGYFPALALGGSGALDTLKKVRAVEHFALLAQLGAPKLYRIQEGGRKLVRHLGQG